MSMKKFAPTFESLYEFECPDWFRDAKFGIWSHWGPQSVPMYGDWYARNMYIEGSQQYMYHVRHYGHPSKFGFKDICALWKAEKFDPDALMNLYYNAGARYFVAQATHHDNFFNYNSKINRFNSVNIGPNKDICQLWKNAADKKSIPFGLTEHLAASFSWWKNNKDCDKSGPYKNIPYDGNNPEYFDFYHENYEHVHEESTPWLTHNKKYMDYWRKSIHEMIDTFKPDLLYSDSELPFGGENYSAGLDAVAYLYNTSIDMYGENRAVYNQKNRDANIYKVGILDIEKSQLPGIQPEPWQTDTCIGNWFYDVKQVYKKPGHIIEMLIDIISKNGVMLLNILQKPDGSIDEWAVYILEEMAKWYSICSEGVYGTRPWRINSEGISQVVIQHFTEDAVSWNSSDYRFTSKGKNVFAFMMRNPENNIAIIKSFAEDEMITEVSMLGHGSLPFIQSFGILSVKLPLAMPTEYPNCLKITLT